MALLHESVESKKFDVRMIERNVARGVISSEDLEKARKQLPDDGENASYVNLETLQDDQTDSG